MTAPRSYGRLPWLHPDDLTEAQRALYRRIVDSPRAHASRALPLTDEDGRLMGPFNAMLLSPEVGAAVQEVGTALRFRGTLTGRMRELAILEVARFRSCPIEWVAHVHAGRRAGLTEGEIDAVRAGRDHPTFADDERLVRRIVADLLTKRDLGDDVVEAASTSIGLPAAVELLMLVGYYDLLALSLHVWRTPGAETARTTLPHL